MTPSQCSRVNIYSLISTLHSTLYCAHCRAACTVNSLAFNGTIHPNGHLPLNRSPLTVDLTAFLPYAAHPFFPCAKTTTTFSYQFPFHFNTSRHNFISLTIHACRCHNISLLTHFNFQHIYSSRLLGSFLVYSYSKTQISAPIMTLLA